MASPLEIETLRYSSILVDAKRKEEESSFDHAVQLMLSSALPMSIQSAIDLGLFDIISKAGTDAKLSVSDIAAKIGTKNPEAPVMLDRILRLLTSHSVLSCSVVNGQRLYSLTAVSKHFATNEDGASLGPTTALLQCNLSLNCWSQIRDAVVEGGIPFNRIYGKTPYQYQDSDPKFNQLFNLGMVNLTTLVMRRILDSYQGFEHLNQVVDVGGGLGIALSLITSKYSYIKGINYDLPHVIKEAPHYPGVEHVGGDMFSKVPCGDAIFLKNVLHDWMDEQCIKLLKNCYTAIPDKGKVIVVETLASIEPNTSLAEKISSELDVIMMTVAPGGKERTQHQFMDLATAAGFSGIKYECLASYLHVMEFIK
ncbi:putative (Iso)eugenol O-methyltransferase [Rosa chinensis]|uniref:caffeate O-methyltransferase n=1 Tax=Rosa chinensis TaxID=74649 RepID=A0A2P6QQ71_ROSCH|nr:caffeic acid 3-O-methyltransferase [Rosa chinensis]PRQ36323.1 putative (Iso)eugenol O-methyltransferase [Rosa chinensis]